MDVKQTLTALPCGHQAVIAEIRTTGDLRRRLFELGFAPGNTIIPVFSDPTGHIRAYAVSCSVIALRRKDAQEILVMEKEETA